MVEFEKDGKKAYRPRVQNLWKYQVSDKPNNSRDIRLTIRTLAVVLKTISHGSTRKQIMEESGICSKAVAMIIKTGKELGLIRSCDWILSANMKYEEVVELGSAPSKKKPEVRVSELKQVRESKERMLRGCELFMMYGKAA